jgi:hypothetical protein
MKQASERPSNAWACASVSSRTPRGERQRVFELDGAQVADAERWFKEASRL